MTVEKKPLDLAAIKARTNAATHGQWMLCEKCHQRVGPGARTDMVGDGRSSDCQCDDPRLGMIPTPTVLTEIWLLIPWDGLPCRTIEKGGTGSSAPYGVRVFGTEQEAMKYSNGSPQWTIAGPFAHAREDVPALIAEVESLRAERDEAFQFVQRIRGYADNGLTDRGVIGLIAVLDTSDIGAIGGRRGPEESATSVDKEEVRRLATRAMDRFKNKEAVAKLRDRNARLEKVHVLHYGECFVCKASLEPPDYPPHCTDCQVTDDALRDWEAAIAAELDAVKP